jgi:hypothetical protein
MSYSLAVRGGDLAKSGSNLDVVWGIEKLKQDLQCWVTEGFGGDRFHPLMGSILQDFIGSVINPRTKAEIEDEVMRVMDNYQRVQTYGFKNNPRLYSMTELLESVDNIAVKIGFDAVSVSVAVRSAARNGATITVSKGV